MIGANPDRPHENHLILEMAELGFVNQKLIPMRMAYGWTNLYASLGGILLREFDWSEAPIFGRLGCKSTEWLGLCDGFNNSLNRLHYEKLPDYRLGYSCGEWVARQIFNKWMGSEDYPLVCKEGEVCVIDRSRSDS